MSIPISAPPDNALRVTGITVADLHQHDWIRIHDPLGNGARYARIEAIENIDSSERRALTLYTVGNDLTETRRIVTATARRPITAVLRTLSAPRGPADARISITRTVVETYTDDFTAAGIRTAPGLADDAPPSGDHVTLGSAVTSMLDDAETDTRNVNIPSRDIEDAGALPTPANGRRR